MEEKTPEKFGKGNFSILIEYKEFNFEIFTQVTNIKNSINYYNHYYKDHLREIFKELIISCSEYDVDPKILLSYLQYIIERFDNACTKFEACKISFQSEKPKQIYENECVFYLDALEGKEILYLVYQDLEGSLIEVPLKDLTLEELEIFKEMGNTNDLIASLVKKGEEKGIAIEKVSTLIAKCIEPIKNIKFDLPTPKSLKSIQNSLGVFHWAIVNNFNIMLSRIHQDMQKIIHPAFLNDFVYPRLTSITPTGSDLHNRGNQVFILEFTDKSKPELARKVVYKPTPVEVDAMLFGANQRLSPHS